MVLMVITFAVRRYTMYEFSFSRDQDDSSSVAITGYQWFSEVIYGSQWLSMVLSSYL